MTQTAQHQADLLALKAEYETRIAKISNHLEHPLDELNHHWDDQAVSMNENEMRKLLLIEAEEGLSHVNAALRRIENGSYGICLTCGEDIDERRLNAVPYTPYCILHAK